jgi:hypothetical protein
VGTPFGFYEGHRRLPTVSGVVIGPGADGGVLVHLGRPRALRCNHRQRDGSVTQRPDVLTEWSKGIYVRPQTVSV